jgi:hypothetical protein
VGISVLFLNDKFKNLDYIKVVKDIIPGIEHQNPYHIKSSRLSSLKSIVRINDKNEYIKGFANYTDISRAA